MTINKYVGSLFIQIFDVMSTSALNWKLITNEIINELNYFWIFYWNSITAKQNAMNNKTIHFGI